MKKNYMNPNMKVVELKSYKPLLLSYSNSEAAADGVTVVLGREDDFDFSDEDFQN